MNSRQENRSKAFFLQPRLWLNTLRNEMLIARGHSDINTTLSVIMSLFCCRSLCLCISLSRCLCLFIQSLSRSFCLPAFFTIIFSPSSRPDSFYLPTFFAKILSSSSNSKALSLAIVFAYSTRVNSCSLLKTCRLHAKISSVVCWHNSFRKL